mgnify:CR=1 FL=1
MAPAHDLPNSSMAEQPPFQLMYRRPGKDSEYEKLTDAIDYLFNKVQELEAEIEILRNQD